MDWKVYETLFEGFAKTLNTTPIDIGYSLIECRKDFPADFEDRKLQLLSYFPQKRQQTIANYESICNAYDRTSLPYNVRISQMDTCRTLPEDKKMEYLEWAAINDFGREEIQSRMLTEGLLIPRRDDAEKYVMDAIKKLDKALPLADEKLRDAIKFAKPALEDGLK